MGNLWTDEVDKNETVRAPSGMRARGVPRLAAADAPFLPRRAPHSATEGGAVYTVCTGSSRRNVWGRLGDVRASVVARCRLSRRVSAEGCRVSAAPARGGR